MCFTFLPSEMTGLPKGNKNNNLITTVAMTSTITANREML
jgi:hypothetical protein